MSPISKADAILASITRRDIENLTPDQRQRLAQRLRYIADIADPPHQSLPKCGILGALNRGDPRHE